ncbi:MAG: ZIP family metal transporter [Candidatus Pacebacteria bacterium]|nr:ZIP family metal transporter [Candidatus Paceibacterota bacterium]PIR59635.1 MAG: hypothetical protein COU68_04535 [Candidatus Pacebacteria bacterium CG10_big_fil_rev_8_21_14_0_10_45_6]
MSGFWPLVALTTLGSIAGLIGGIAFLYIKSWTAFLNRYSIPFAAGVFLTVALLGVLPEALELASPDVLLTTLLAFLAAYVLEVFVVDVHHHDDPGHNHLHKSSAKLVVVGDTIHNLLDGVAISAAYLANPGLGVVTALSTFFHEVPHEIGDFGILLKAGWQKKHIIWVNLVSACATFLGAILIFVFNPSELLQGHLLGATAGIFLYLCAVDFLPQTQKNTNKKESIVALLLGVLVMFVVISLTPHH